MPEIIDLFSFKLRGVKGFKESKANAILAVFALKFPTPLAYLIFLKIDILDYQWPDTNDLISKKIYILL